MLPNKPVKTVKACSPLANASSQKNNNGAVTKVKNTPVIRFSMESTEVIWNL